MWDIICKARDNVILGIKLKDYIWFSKAMQIFKLQIFIRRKDFFIALHLIEPISAYLLCWPKSLFSFSIKYNAYFFILTNNFIDLDILSMSAGYLPLLSSSG